jgi:sec-independent protein translocase protein TatA
MEGFGIEKILLLLLIVLLLFGARRIPELAGSMGKGIREFKKNLTDPDHAAREAQSVRAEARSDRVAAPPASAPSERDEATPEPKRLMR